MRLVLQHTTDVQRAFLSAGEEIEAPLHSDLSIMLLWLRFLFCGQIYVNKSVQPGVCIHTAMEVPAHYLSGPLI